MIDFKSRAYVARVMHLMEDYVGIMELNEDLQKMLDEGGEVELHNISVNVDLAVNDISESLEKTITRKQNELEELEKQIRNLVYGSANVDLNGN